MSQPFVAFPIPTTPYSSSVSGTLGIVRAQIPTSTILANTIVVAGFAAAGDWGAGAIYTSVGAGPSSIGAIQDASATWFRLVFNGPFVHAGWFGVKADGVTNDAAALNAALAAKAADTVSAGGVVFLPEGTTIVGSQIVVPTSVKLQGAGKRASAIIASGSFPINTPVIQLGRVTDSLVFDCMLQDLSAAANLIAGSIVVYGINLNEGCGCSSFIAADSKDTAVFLDTGCIHGRWTDLEIDITNAPANYGIKLNGGGHVFDRVSISGNGVGNTLAAVNSIGSYLDVRNINMEFCTDGLLIGSGSSGSVLGWGGNGVTNLVHFTDASDVALIGGIRSFATNLIQDDLTATTIGNNVNNWAILPFWTRTAPFVNLAPTVVTSSPYTLVNTDNTIIANRVGASVGLIFPAANNNLGRTLSIVNDQPQLVVSINTDIVPLGGGAAGTAILPATIGAWAILKSDGTHWVIIAQGALTAGTSPTFIVAASYTVAPSDTAISVNVAGTCTLTMPTPASNVGRTLWIRTITANAVISNASNIGSLIGGVGTGILAATAGKWAFLQCDGTFWQIFGAN